MKKVPANDVEKFLARDGFSCTAYHARITKATCHYLRCRNVVALNSICQTCLRYKKPTSAEIREYKSQYVEKRRLNALFSIRGKQRHPTAKCKRNKRFSRKIERGDSAELYAAY